MTSLATPAAIAAIKARRIQALRLACPLAWPFSSISTGSKRLTWAESTS